MTKTFSALAAALLAVVVLFAGRAEACISCEYTPEVIKPSAAPKAQKAKRAQQKRPAAAKKEQAARPSQKRVGKRPPAAKEAVTEDAEETAKAEPVEAKAEQESETEAAQVSDEPAASSGSATAAFAGRDAARAEEARGDGEKPAAARCTKFSAQVGGVVEVPCN